MSDGSNTKQTEHINNALLDLDLRDNQAILNALANSQSRAAVAAHNAITSISTAVNAASERLKENAGRLIMVGAGASGRLAVQDGAELWPTYGWPAERLLLRIAGGKNALLNSIEGVEDNIDDARSEVTAHQINAQDVVLGIAASGSSAWTVTWIEQARLSGALTVGLANNSNTPLLLASEHSILLDSGEEVLAGSTRMAAGTAQKIALNMFSTLLMIRLNRTYGNLMVDMAASNAKLDERRLRMLQTLVPDVERATAVNALAQSKGWVKLAALLCSGLSTDDALRLLDDCNGSLRKALSVNSS